MTPRDRSQDRQRFGATFQCFGEQLDHLPVADRHRRGDRQYLAVDAFEGPGSSLHHLGHKWPVRIPLRSLTHAGAKRCGYASGRQRVRGAGARHRSEVGLD